MGHPDGAFFLTEQLRATRALLKFCREHHYGEDALVHIERCRRALERGQVRAAVRHYRAVPLGGMGCFNDGWPPVVFDHEDEAYVIAVFEALTERWSRLMSLSDSS